MAVDDSYTKSLLHFDGADAATTFTDESGKTWTARGNAQIDTAQFVFGGASGLFDGTGDYIDTPGHADFDFSTGDFTIDDRMRFNSFPGGGIILLSSETTGHLSISIDATNVSLSRVNVAVDKSWAHGMSTGAFYHIAVVRNGNSIDCYIEGSKVGTTYDATGNSYGIGSGTACVGGHSSAYYHDGWIEELRISKGIARWTANFTPAGYAYGQDFIPQIIMS